GGRIQPGPVRPLAAVRAAPAGGSDRAGFSAPHSAGPQPRRRPGADQCARRAGGHGQPGPARTYPAPTDPAQRSGYPERGYTVAHGAQAAGAATPPATGYPGPTLPRRSAGPS